MERPLPTKHRVRMGNQLTSWVLAIVAGVFISAGFSAQKAEHEALRTEGRRVDKGSRTAFLAGGVALMIAAYRMKRAKARPDTSRETWSGD